jgi:7-cyano-7-deazaguanine synthase
MGFIDVPTNGAKPGVISITYVPGRNTVFLAIALSLAEAKGAEAIYLGINAVDYSGYPDCRPEYLDAVQHLATLSSKAGLEGNASNPHLSLWQEQKLKALLHLRFALLSFSSPQNRKLAPSLGFRIRFSESDK